MQSFDQLKINKIVLSVVVDLRNSKIFMSYEGSEVQHTKKKKNTKDV